MLLPPGWSLEEGWAEIDYKWFIPIPLYSKSCSGSLRLVSRTIGGWSLGKDLKRLPNTGELITVWKLLGCFVGKELRPRFLGILGPLGEVAIYTTEGIHSVNGLAREMSNVSLESTLTEVSLRLWKI